MISDLDNGYAGLHGRRSWGTGDESPEFGVGTLNANCPPRFCHFSQFQAADCLHYNAIMQ